MNFYRKIRRRSASGSYLDCGQSRSGLHQVRIQMRLWRYSDRIPSRINCGGIASERHPSCSRPVYRAALTVARLHPNCIRTASEPHPNCIRSVVGLHAKPHRECLDGSRRICRRICRRLIVDGPRLSPGHMKSPIFALLNRAGA